MVAHSKGFACSGSNGTLHLFERTDDPNVYREARAVNIAEESAEVAGEGEFIEQ